MKVPRGGRVKKLWRLCGRGSRQREGGLSNLIHIARAAHGLAIQGNTFRQERRGGEGFTKLAVLGAPGASGCAFAGDFHKGCAIGGVEGDAAVVGTGPAPALAGQDVTDIGLAQADGLWSTGA